jgi:hypothetical protein
MLRCMNALLLAVTAALSHSLAAPSLIDVELNEASSAAGSDDVARVRAHLLRAEAALRDETVSSPQAPPSVTARRALLDELREYTRRGVFPHNHDRAGRTPVFIDEHGTPCAVGALIIASGPEGAALAHEISRTRNFARVHELASDERVRAWAIAHGFTIDELQRIQPSYSYGAPRSPVNLAGEDLCKLVESNAGASAIASFVRTMPKKYVTWDGPREAQVAGKEAASALGKDPPLTAEQVARVLTMGMICAVTAGRADALTALVDGGGKIRAVLRPDRVTFPDDEMPRAPRWDRGLDRVQTPLSVAVESGSPAVIAHLVKLGALTDNDHIVPQAILRRDVQVLRALRIDRVPLAARAPLSCGGEFVDGGGRNDAKRACLSVVAATEALVREAPRFTGGGSVSSFMVIAEPLHVAVTLDDVEAVKLLLAVPGVDVNAPSELRLYQRASIEKTTMAVSALDLARAQKHAAMIELLGSHGATGLVPEESWGAAPPANEAPRTEAARSDVPRSDVAPTDVPRSDVARADVPQSKLLIAALCAASVLLVVAALSVAASRKRRRERGGAS